METLSIALACVELASSLFPHISGRKDRQRKGGLQAGTPEFLPYCPWEHHLADLTWERTRVEFIANLVMAFRPLASETMREQAVFSADHQQELSTTVGIAPGLVSRCW